MKPDFSPRIRRYLRQVTRHLSLPRSIRMRIVNDLSTAIAGKLEAGISEDTVLQELGKPRAVAAEFNTQMADKVIRRSPWRFLPLAVSIFAGIILLGQLAIQLLMQNLFGSALEVNGIIGGADGPTAVFVTSVQTATIDWELLIWGTLVVLGLAGYFLLRRGKRRED